MAQIPKLPKCGTCKFSIEYGNENAVACHRYPPTITKVDEQVAITSHFPLVHREFWCGEWALKRKPPVHM